MVLWNKKDFLVYQALKQLKIKSFQVPRQKKFPLDCMISQQGEQLFHLGIQGIISFLSISVKLLIKMDMEIKQHKNLYKLLEIVKEITIFN